MKVSNYFLILAVIIGNAIETYDLSIYSLFSSYLVKAFFPHQNSFVSLLNVLSIFFFGFLTRPVGALYFGRMGDYYGRRKALLSSSLLMLIATGMIGLLPTYQYLGYVSVILLALLRMLQAFSYAGEFSSSLIYLIEYVPQFKRNSIGSLATMGNYIGILMASITCLVISLNFSESEIMLGLWRIPFLISFLFSALCFIFRSFIEETQYSHKHLSKNNLDKRSIFKLLSNQKLEFALVIVLTWFGVITTYLLFIYFVPYLTNILHYPLSLALKLNVISVALLILLIPIAGWITNYIKKDNKYVSSCVVSLAILITPYLYFLSTPHYYITALLQIAITIPAAFYFARIPVKLVELIPPLTRCRTFSFGYNISASIFGGTLPLIALSLVQTAGISYLPGFYLIFCAALTLILLNRLKHNHTHASISSEGSALC